MILSTFAFLAWTGHLMRVLNIHSVDLPLDDAMCVSILIGSEWQVLRDLIGGATHFGTKRLPKFHFLPEKS